MRDPRRVGEGDRPSRGQGIRDAKPQGQETLGGWGASCTERREVGISMTGGVEGAERGRK